MDDPFECLPENILHTILSLLPSRREAARTAFISRSWRRAWHSCPLFDFDFEDYLPDRYRHSYYDLPRRLYEQFLGFVDVALSRFHEQGYALPRLKICTAIKELDKSPGLLNKWIGVALDDGAKELFLKLENHGCQYALPDRVFSSPHLQTLTLVGIRPVLRGRSLNSCSTVLQSLQLVGTPINERMLQNLLRGCPLLKDVRLDRCEWLREVVISGLARLRRLDLAFTCRHPRVEIEAPSLKYLCYCSDNKDADESGIVAPLRCPKLKHLELKDDSITPERFRAILSSVPLLETLTFANCDKLSTMVISSPMLKKIKMSDVYLVDLEVNAPKLVSWFHQLRNFLARSRTVRSLSINISYVDEHELRRRDPLPYFPCNIDKLKLEGRWLRSYQLDAILHWLFSACHPATLRIKGDSFFLEFIFGKLDPKRNDNSIGCHCSDHVKCWFHELKGVEIGGIKGSEARNMEGLWTGIPLDCDMVSPRTPVSALDCIGDN